MKKFIWFALLISACGNTITDPTDPMFIIELGKYQVSFMYTADDYPIANMQDKFMIDDWLIWYEDGNYTIETPRGDKEIGSVDEGSLVFKTNDVGPEAKCPMKLNSYSVLYPSINRDAFIGSGTSDFQVAVDNNNGCRYNVFKSRFTLMGVRVE